MLAMTRMTRRSSHERCGIPTVSKIGIVVLLYASIKSRTAKKNVKPEATKADKVQRKIDMLRMMFRSSCLFVLRITAVKTQHRADVTRVGHGLPGICSRSITKPAYSESRQLREANKFKNADANLLNIRLPFALLAAFLWCLSVTVILCPQRGQVYP